MGDLPQTVFVAAIVLIGLTSLAISIRFWDRLGIDRVHGWDDCLVFSSWVFSVIICSVIVALTKYGLGVHHNNVPHQEYEMFLKAQLQIVSSISYSLGITSAKASFAFLYMRLFPVRRLAILNKAVVVFLLFQAIEESLVVPLRCRPIRKSWIPDLEGYCLDLHPLWYSTFAFNFATDIILFLQPILVARKLQMPALKRLELAAMFSLGFFVTGMGFIRLKYVLTLNTDDTYELAEPLIWSASEICSLVTCACVPSFRRVALRIPWVKTAFGVTTGQGSGICLAQQGTPIQLQHRNRNKYIQSTTTRINSTNPFPPTTQTTATALGTMDDRLRDFFPNKADASGAIIVTREVVHSIKSFEDRAELKANDMI
ncbi:hypothetical protein O1611_g2503 [Lasiodiplodia mahajangana]|uniref:Uncharacterized protein n=1 Tax=Lasiodiplodia mahajangana TaxID=1108764 RepID=A0ACC2JV91_9PEZI|nr:hypothetical protein O1611_g2503 [Lasiodiplodia mahajangana]